MVDGDAQAVGAGCRVSMHAADRERAATDADAAGRGGAIAPIYVGVGVGQRFDSARIAGGRYGPGEEHARGGPERERATAHHRRIDGGGSGGRTIMPTAGVLFNGAVAT